ncbi:hypothetical protein WJX79_006266 [Trebouxia sp. C0005]
MESLLRVASGPASPAARQRHGRGKNFRRNTLTALAICLIILGFAASPSNHHVVSTEKELRQLAGPTGTPEDVLQKMQHHTLTVEECTGSKCTTEVQSGGALLTDEAKDRVALLNQAASQQRLTEANPALVQRAAEIADELSNHNAAAHHEGDNILEIHRDAIGLSSKPVDPATLSNLTHISDDNNLQIMQDTNSASLLSGFNSDEARAEAQEQQSDTSAGTSAIRLGTAQRHLFEQNWKSNPDATQTPVGC